MCLCVCDVCSYGIVNSNLQDILFSISCFAQNITLTIEAWDRENCWDQEIDGIDRSIPLLVTNEQRMVQVKGKNGIGLFHFAYHVQNTVNNYGECFAKTTTADHCICPSLPVTELPSPDSGISQPIMESTAPWAWISVAIIFMLLTIVFFTVSVVMACIVRQKNKALKQQGNQQRSNSGTNGIFK